MSVKSYAVPQASRPATAISLRVTTLRHTRGTDGGARLSQRQKIREDAFSVSRAHRLGMELYPVDRQRPVAQRHDLGAGRPVRRPGADLELGGEAQWRDHQRMIPHGLERTGNLLEDGMARVLDHGGFPVHKPISPDHPAAEGVADRLMAQADSEEGYSTRGGADQRDRDSGLAGTTRPGRDDNGGRREG